MALFQSSAHGFFLHHVSTAAGPSAHDTQWHGPGALCALKLQLPHHGCWSGLEKQDVNPSIPQAACSQSFQAVKRLQGRTLCD